MHGRNWGRGPRQYLGLHGWNGTHQTFLPLVSQLPEDVAFRGVDLPGCGNSSPPARWDLDSIVAEVAAEIDGPATLIGNCSGAILALLVACKMPSLVERVVMIDAFAWWPWYLRIFLSTSIGRYAYFSTFANPVGRWIANASLRAKRSQTTSLTSGFESADHEVTYKYLSLLSDAGKPEDFAHLPMPIDVLYGERSFAAVRRSAFGWAGVFPRARIFELKDAGHLPIIEAAPQVREIIFGGNPCPTPQPAHLLNSVR